MQVWTWWVSWSAVVFKVPCFGLGPQTLKIKGVQVSNENDDHDDDDDDGDDDNGGDDDDDVTLVKSRPAHW